MRSHREIIGVHPEERIRFVRACVRSCVCQRDDASSRAELRKHEMSSSAARVVSCRALSGSLVEVVRYCKIMLTRTEIRLNSVTSN